MKKLLLFFSLILVFCSCNKAPVEVINAVDEANLDCPVNLHVAKIESVELEDENIVYTLTCGQIIRNIVLSSPDEAKVAIVTLLKSTAGQAFINLTDVAKEFQYNIVIRVEDENGEYDPVDITVTPEEIANMKDTGIQLNLF